MMGGGQGPDTFERIYVGNASSVTVFNPNLPPAPGEPPSVRFLKPVEGAGCRVAAYKGFVYSTNIAGNGDQDLKAIDIFKADGPNDQSVVAQLKANYSNPFSIFAYKDYIYVAFGFEDIFGTVIEVFEAYVPGSSRLTSVAEYKSGRVISSLYVYNDYLYVAEIDQILAGRLAVYNAYQGAGTDLIVKAQTALDFPFSITAFNDYIYVSIELSKIAVFDAYAGGPLTQKTEVYVEGSDNGYSFITAYKGYIYDGFWEENSESSIVRVFEAYKPGVQTTPLFQYSTLDVNKSALSIIPYDGKLYLPAVDGKFVTLLDAYQGVETNPDPIAVWENDMASAGGAAYNGEHPEGNLYIDKSGSNVV